MKEKIKRKIESLLKSGVKIDFLPAEKHSVGRFKIDKFIFSTDECTRENIEGQSYSCWDEFIWVDFQNNPICYGKEARELRQFVLGDQGSLLDKYLDDLN